MSKKKYLKNIKVNSPCDEEWEEMSGNKQVRLCSHCDLSVNNLSEMTQNEAKTLINNSDGNLCVRYVQHPKTQAPVFADKLYKITRQTGIAAGVLGASLAATSLTYAQGSSGPPIKRTRIDTPTITTIGNSNNSNLSAQNDEKVSKGSGKISGVVTDLTGAIIPNALVKISYKNIGQTALSDEYGSYSFENVPAGNYLVTIKAPNFQAHKVINLIIEDKSNETINAQLALELGTLTMGAIALVIEIENPLIKAVYDNKIRQARTLIARGFDVNTKDKGFNSRTALHTAVEENNLKILRLLLNAGAIVNLLDEDGNSPIMMLNSNTSVDIVRLLIKYGANLNVQSKDGQRTALINAALDDNFKVMKVLIEAGANVNLRDEDGDSAFDLTSNESIEQLLIAYGAEIESATN